MWIKQLHDNSLELSQATDPSVNYSVTVLMKEHAMLCNEVHT